MIQTTFAIDTRTLVRIAVTVLAVWFLYLVRDIIAILLVAVVITAALHPLIARFEGPRMPRIVVVAGTYLTFFALTGLMLALILPILGHQMSQLATMAGTMLDQARTTTWGTLLGLDRLTGDDLTGGIGASVSGSLGEVFSRTASIVSGMIGMFAAISMSFYMSLRRNGMKRFLLSLMPAAHKPYAASLADRIQESFGRWMAGQLVVMLFVGSLYTIALWALGVPYALVLGVFGGLMEIIPYLGPIVSAVPAIAVGFTISPVTGIAVAACYWVINLVENHVLIPQIMNKTTGLDPVAIILALLVGAKLAGLVGIILAVPLATALAVFLKDVMNRKISA